MVELSRNRAARAGNLIAIGAMCLFWIVPMIRFWGAVWGPLRPFGYPQTHVAPPWTWVVAATAACFIPCLFPSRYFQCWERERGLRIYVGVGVRRFKRYATNGDLINQWARRLDSSYRIIRDGSSAQSWADKTREGERSHTVLLLMGFVAVAYAVWIGWHGWAFGLAISNIVFNGYPIFLQRYNRCRIERLFAPWPSAGGMGNVR